MKVYRSPVMASVLGITVQTLDSWVDAGRFTPAVTNEAGHPLWSVEQLREAHAFVRQQAQAEIDRATAALIDAGVLDEYEQQCDALRPVAP